MARRSGLTKDQVIATLDVMEFIAWQAGYEPSEYAPYIPEVEEETYIVIEDTEDSYNIATLPSIFIDEKRQRNFAA